MPNSRAADDAFLVLLPLCISPSKLLAVSSLAPFCPALSHLSPTSVIGTIRAGVHHPTTHAFTRSLCLWAPQPIHSCVQCEKSTCPSLRLCPSLRVLRVRIPSYLGFSALFPRSLPRPLAAMFRLLCPGSRASATCNRYPVSIPPHCHACPSFCRPRRRLLIAFTLVVPLVLRASLRVRTRMRLHICIHNICMTMRLSFFVFVYVCV